RDRREGGHRRRRGAAHARRAEAPRGSLRRADGPYAQADRRVHEAGDRALGLGHPHRRGEDRLIMRALLFASLLFTGLASAAAPAATDAQAKPFEPYVG